jgi:hypothetical protein
MVRIALFLAELPIVRRNRQSAGFATLSPLASAVDTRPHARYAAP